MADYSALSWNSGCDKYVCGFGLIDDLRLRESEFPDPFQ
jgi:hypothetical protein